MKFNKKHFKINTLRNKIWLYLIIFCIVILSFLWFFQVIFLNGYYELVKTKEISSIASKIANNYGSESFNEILDSDDKKREK